jgi:hypothetical protein
VSRTRLRAPPFDPSTPADIIDELARTREDHDRLERLLAEKDQALADERAAATMARDRMLGIIESHTKQIADMREAPPAEKSRGYWARLTGKR